MSELKTVLDVIKSITANRESGRLEINSSGMYGTLLFNEGRLVDARLESLSGFQAVNAAVAMRDVEFSFDHVPPASHASTITASERVVLKRFFGIEAAEMGVRAEVEPEWNATPEQVVPLAEVEEVALEGTPTVEVARVRSVPLTSARGRSFGSRSRLVVAACLVLLAGLTIVLISKFKAPQESEVVASAVESPSPSNASEANVPDLTGEWRVINTVEKTAYRSFDNMQIGFRLVIDQQGKEFTARGEKFSENGQTLPLSSRTPIRVKGTIDGDKIVATFVEDGRTRQTDGRFVWRVQHDGFAGTFVSSAANSSGRSAVTKQQ